MPAIAAQRRSRILELAKQRGIVSVRELCDEFDVSDMTIRRDFELLSRQGALQRTHGGAIALLPAVPTPTYAEREQLEAVAKRAIGAAAAALVADGDTIFLSSGTTVAAMVPELRERQRLTVITNSVRVLMELLGAPAVTVVSVGGLVSEATGSLVGPVAVDNLTHLRVPRAFLGTTGINAEGLSNLSLDEAAVQREVMAMAAESIVLADHTKFGTPALAWVGPLARTSRLVTDRLPPDDGQRWLDDAGVGLIVAPELTP